MWLWLVIVSSWIGVLMFECRGFFSRDVPFDNYDRALDEHKRRHANNSIDVDNVTGEMIHVRTLKPQKRYFYKAICENLGLIEKKKILVDRVSLTIKPGDSVGVIGTNCINAHALLNLLAGDTKPSFGRLYINGVSMTDDPKKAKAHIGYVPTYCSIMGEMTCYQALKMFCILYGYAFDEIDEICQNLSKNLGFYTQLHEPLMKCSPGITDRISYSVAVLKKPSLLCICNYSWSVDPIGRRQWTRLLVALAKEQGTAAAITWVHNCHTEIACNKIVVMNEGQFTHIGHPSEIAPELMKGYVVLMRMKKYIQTPQGVLPKVLFHLTTYMEDKFPTSFIIQEGTIMQYFIPHKGTTFAYVYKNLRDNLFSLNIESISITSMNMSYVFGRLTEEAIQKSNTEVLSRRRSFFQS